MPFWRKYGRLDEAEEYYGSFGWQTTKNFFQVQYEFVYILLGDLPAAFTSW
jgi:hypothetical protein